MSRIPGLLSVLLPCLAALAWVYLNFESFLESFAGRITIDHSRLTKWEHHAYINNAACTVQPALHACEDVKIHQASSTAFISCGNPAERTRWYPAIARNVEQRTTFREALFKLDVASGKATELKIHGLDGDFVTHGLDIYSIPEDTTKILIFAVNHARSSDSICVFAHQLGSDDVYLVKEVKHANIKTANGVAATGPQSFFVTNDHHFSRGVLRDLEEQWGPWSWASNVQYCTFDDKTVQCHQASESVPGANGLAVSGKQLYLGDSKNGTVSVFDVEDNNTLRRTHHVDLGAAADNIRVMPGSGDLIVSIFPTLENMPLMLANVNALGKTLKVPSAALRLRRADGFKPELLFHDDGSVLSFMTAADIDMAHRVMVGAAVLQYGAVAVCKLPPDFK